MTSESTTKPVREKKVIAERWITEWTIEQATTLGHVSVGFVVTKESHEGARRSVTPHFLLRVDRAVELMNELKNVLEDAEAIRCLEELAASPVLTSNPQPVAISSSGGESDDSERLASHFELGAYGLVGN